MKVLKYIFLLNVLYLSDSKVENRLFNFELIKNELHINFKFENDDKKAIKIQTTNDTTLKTIIYKNKYNCESEKDCLDSNDIQCETNFTPKKLMIKIYKNQEKTNELNFCYNSTDSEDKSIVFLEDIFNLIKQNFKDGEKKYHLKFISEPSQSNYINNENIITKYNKFEVTLNPDIPDDKHKIDITKSNLFLTGEVYKLHEKEYNTKFYFSYWNSYDVKILTTDTNILDLSSKILEDKEEKNIEGRLIIKFKNDNFEDFSKQYNQLYSNKNEIKTINFLATNSTEETLYIGPNYLKNLASVYKYYDNDNTFYIYYKKDTKGNLVLFIVLLASIVISLILTIFLVKLVKNKKIEEVDEDSKDSDVNEEEIQENKQGDKKEISLLKE